MEDEKVAGHSHLEAISSHEAKMDGKVLITLAKDASEFEHQLSPLQAIKAYPMAIFWSLMVSMCVVMEGELSSPQILKIDLQQRKQATTRFLLEIFTHIHHSRRNTGRIINLSTVEQVVISSQPHGRQGLAMPLESGPSSVYLQMDG